MIKYIVIASACIATLSCSKPSASVAGMTISADKEVIESDGKDMAVFTIRDADGNVISTDANIEAVTYKNVATGRRLPRFSTGFSSIVDGVYEFVGIYGGVETVNSVKITSANRSDYEVYHKNVAVFKLTGTWCPACPRMTSALHSLDEDALSHSVVLACHNEDEGHPFRVSYRNTDLANAVFSVMGETQPLYPSLCYDLAMMSNSSSTVTIAEEIMQRRIDDPASVGVGISSFSFVGDALKIAAKVKASASGRYDVACAVLADGRYYAEGTEPDGIYDNVVLAVSGTNFLSGTSSTSFFLEAGQEIVREFEFTVSSSLSQDYKEALKTVVIVHEVTDDGGSSVNNSAVCRLGETLDYEYN